MVHKRKGKKSVFFDPKYLFLILLFTSIIGLRHEVGGDFYNYNKVLDIYRGTPFLENLNILSEPLFKVLLWFGGNIWGEIYLVNVICAFIFSWGLLKFCIDQKRPELALLVAIPYFVTVVSMGYVRQGVAISLAMVALLYLIKGSYVKFIAIVFVAGLFHKTVLLYTSFALFVKVRNRFLLFCGFSLFAFLIFVFYLEEYLREVLTDKTFVGQDSKGTLIRILITNIAAVIFILYRKKFQFTDREKDLWTWISAISFLFIVLYFISPSTTIVDRLALYWIPLQIAIFSKVPDVFGVFGKKNSFWVYLIIFANLIILLVWLNFSPHSEAWLPYRFFPFEWAFN